MKQRFLSVSSVRKISDMTDSSRYHVHASHASSKYVSKFNSKLTGTKPALWLIDGDLMKSTEIRKSGGLTEVLQTNNKLILNPWPELFDSSVMIENESLKPEAIEILIGYDRQTKMYGFYAYSLKLEKSDLPEESDDKGNFRRLRQLESLVYIEAGGIVNVKVIRWTIGVLYEWLNDIRCALNAGETRIYNQSLIYKIRKPLTETIVPSRITKMATTRFIFESQTAIVGRLERVDIKEIGKSFEIERVAVLVKAQYATASFHVNDSAKLVDLEDSIAKCLRELDEQLAQYALDNPEKLDGLEKKSEQNGSLLAINHLPRAINPITASGKNVAADLRASYMKLVDEEDNSKES